MRTKGKFEKPDRNRLIKLEPIIEIIRSAIWTGKLADERPVSVMLIAEQESAKTEALKYFRGTSTLKYMSDLTSRGMSPYKNDIQDGKMRHVVLLDLVRILSHGKGVSERTIQTLASLMEEGESETSDAGGRDSWDNFPRIGALMGITPSFFKSKRGRWRQTGFLTRFVPIAFRYKDSTVDLIHNSIGAGHKLPDPHPEPTANFQAVQIYCDQKYSGQISLRAKSLGITMKTYGFRYHRTLRALAKAAALIERKGAVDQSHVDKVIRWSEFFTDKEIEL